MSENKFDQFSDDLFDSNEFELEDINESNDTSKKVTKTDNKNTEEKISITEDNIQESEKNDIILEDESNPFDIEGDNINLDNDVESFEDSKPKKTLDKKKLAIIGGVVFVFIGIIITLIFILTGDNKKSGGMPPVEYIDEILEETTSGSIEVSYNVDDGTELENETDLNEDIIELENDSDKDIPKNNTITEDENSNHRIITNSNSNDDVINITEAILSPSSVKVKLNNLGEFDGTEENNNDSSFVKIKESSLVIPTVSKANFVPNVEIEVVNTQKTYTTSDLIKIEFNVLLNSKTLSYNISKKIYKDKDFIIDLSLSPISSDIVSIEENFIKEEVTIPLNIMNKGTHTVWFKINNYPVESYTFNIK